MSSPLHSNITFHSQAYYEKRTKLLWGGGGRQEINEAPFLFLSFFFYLFAAAAGDYEYIPQLLFCVPQTASSSCNVGRNIRRAWVFQTPDKIQNLFPSLSALFFFFFLFETQQQHNMLPVYIIYDWTAVG